MRSKLFIAVCVLAASMGSLSCKDRDKSTTDKTTTVKAEEDDQEKWACLDSTDKSLLQDTKDLEEMWADSTLLKDTSLFFLKKTAAKDVGKVIPYKDIKLCMDEYERVMRLHGIDERDPTNVALSITRTLKITSSEMFQGKPLHSFLREAAKKRKKLFRGTQRKNLAVFTALGIYTQDFIDKHGGAERKGRVGVFLITQQFKEDRASNRWLQDGFDDSGFNFGGIKP